MHSVQKMVRQCALGTEGDSSVCTQYRRWFVSVHSVQKMVRPYALIQKMVRPYALVQKMVRPCRSVYVLSSSRTDPECELLGVGEWGGSGGGGVTSTLP